MGLHTFEIKLCSLNSSVDAAWSEIENVVPDFISQKLKKLQEVESLPFCHSAQLLLPSFYNSAV